jgi:Transposase DDE domain group 1
MRFADPFPQTQEDTRKVKTQTTAQTVEVRADGEGLVSHAGVYLLAELADRVGLTEALSEAMAPTRERRCAHDPGVVLRDLAVAVADGGDHVSDLGVLRGQEALFGAVASETTAHRVIKSIDPALLEAIRAARAKALARAWDAGARPKELILDIDASLLGVHSEKEGAAGTYKGGFGFHPLLCCLAETGEPLAALLRPGNAGANTAADHFEVLQLALEQLPATDLHREILARADIGGRTQRLHLRLPRGRHPLLGRLRGRSTGARGDPAHAGVGMAERDRRRGDRARRGPSHRADRPPRSLRLARGHEADHSPRAPPSRCPVRGLRRPRLPPHRLITDQEDADVAALELRHRRRARVEDAIRVAKETGMRKMPFAAFVHHQAWLEVSLLAQGMLRWNALLCLDGELALVEPKRVRQRLGFESVATGLAPQPHVHSSHCRSQPARERAPTLRFAGDRP